MGDEFLAQRISVLENKIDAQSKALNEIQRHIEALQMETLGSVVPLEGFHDDGPHACECKLVDLHPDGEDGDGI